MKKRVVIRIDGAGGYVWCMRSHSGWAYSSAVGRAYMTIVGVTGSIPDAHHFDLPDCTLPEHR